ncbi:MAG: 50S ribosomal protein L25 [Phycisphaerae bacterium]|nr:50S ribosomal protein L25 [Phycisphaerae bacterium]
MDTQTITATKRGKSGTKDARRLRKQGQLPAIVYGHGEAPEMIALPYHEVEVALEHGTHLLKLDFGGKQDQYLIKDVQYDYLGTTPIHMDLARVGIHEVVEVSIPIELRGTPVGISDGGLLDQVMVDLEVRCLVTAIPESVRPNVAALGLGQSLHVRDLKLPDGVEAVNDGDDVVAVVRALAAAAEAPEEAEGEEGGAEPEIIGREKKEEESDSGD